MRREPISPEMALSRLATLCARAERCRHELEQKLYAWGVPRAEGERLLRRLEEERYFDDSRFAAAFTRDKALYARWGRRKIEAALRLKRITAADIQAAFDELDEDEYRAAMLDALAAKARSIKEGDTYEGRTKLYRFGLSRGYEPSLLSEAIRSHLPFRP